MAPVLLRLLEKAQPSDDPENPDDKSWIILDQVVYDDAPPWPVDADGTGDSLNRIDVPLPGCYPANWQADTPTPGW